MSQAYVSWIELEIPSSSVLTPPRAYVSWAEVEFPTGAAPVSARAYVSWAEFELPTGSAPGIAVTERPDIASLVGANLAVLAGTLYAVEAPDTMNMTGSSLPVGISGTIAVTERPDLAVLGSIQTTGSIAVIERADVAALSGYVARIGIIAVTEAADTIALVGTGDTSGNQPFLNAFTAAYAESAAKVAIINARQDIRMEGLADGLTRLPPP